ncbi:hypothetical protein HY041_00825 [Candidatus Roizmanbacteria bacterium]|nr:hypothetical protein [Candidatus Roizmanbacteria bacterium]
MRQIIAYIFLSLFLFLGVFSVSAQTPTSSVRFAACDLCGYCPPNPPPQKWLNCKRCLYPGARDDPRSGDTLKIFDPTTNIPPTPVPGKQYTMLGCIGTNLGTFQKEGAVAGVVQTLLNIVFSIVGGVAFLSLIYGSFIIMTSQSNPERLNYGKRVVYGAIVGVIFSLSSVFLVNLIGSGILKIPGFGSNSP